MGIIIPTDFHIFQRGLKPPTTIYICNYIELSISSFELSHHPTWNSVDHLPGRQVLPVAMAVFLAPCEAWNIRKFPIRRGKRWENDEEI
jgi:hypothetical protein